MRKDKLVGSSNLINLNILLFQSLLIIPFRPFLIELFDHYAKASQYVLPPPLGPSLTYL